MVEHIAWFYGFLSQVPTSDFHISMEREWGSTGKQTPPDHVTAVSSQHQLITMQKTWSGNVKEKEGEEGKLQLCGRMFNKCLSL